MVVYHPTYKLGYLPGVGPACAAGSRCWCGALALLECGGYAAR